MSAPLNANRSLPGPGGRPPGRGFWPMRDLPTVFWLVATLAAVVFHALIPFPRWLIIHLLLLGAITHAILVWSQYFSFALLRSRASHADRRTQNARLVLSNTGAILVLIGVPSGLPAMTLSGAALLVCAAVWHAASIVQRGRKSLPGRFGRTIRYYIASASLLVIGLALGALLAVGEGVRSLALAHVIINVFGWIGLTVAGTVVTLWPTMLRTRADDFAASGANRALPLLAVGVVVAAGGSALASHLVLAAGCLVYAAGLALIGVSLLRAARGAPPKSFAALSVGSALAWWFGIVVTVGVGAIVVLAQGQPFASVIVLLRSCVPYLAAGFAVQVLIGALSYLVPVVLGGGPNPVRVGTREFDRLGAVRIIAANLGLVTHALPLGDALNTAGMVLYVLAVATFLPVMVLGMRQQRLAKRVQN